MLRVRVRHKRRCTSSLIAYFQNQKSHRQVRYQFVKLYCDLINRFVQRRNYSLD